MTTAVDVSAVKRRLAPWLNEPYFEVESRWLSMGKQKCDHTNHGVMLVEVDRHAICKGCGMIVDPFDALLNYARAEQRLVGTLKTIEDRERAEVEKKQREKDRRPFLRKVVGMVPKHDLTLKAEPIVGYVLTLECGHNAECGPDRKLKNVTCHQCAMSGKKTVRA